MCASGTAAAIAFLCRDQGLWWAIKTRRAVLASRRAHALPNPRRSVKRGWSRNNTRDRTDSGRAGVKVSASHTDHDHEIKIKGGSFS